MRKKSKDTIWDCLNTILNEECYCPTVDNNFFNDELNRISNTVEENLSKLDKEKENGIVKIKIKSPNLNLDKEFKINDKENFEDFEKEIHKILSEEIKDNDMKNIIEKVDKKNKLNEKNILENNFNSDYIDFLEKLFPITEENKIEGKITCKDCDESQCVGNCCKVGVITNEELRKRIFNGERLENIFDEVGKWDNNGIACVRHNGLYNFINTKIQLISDEWFDLVGSFYEGFAVVELRGKWNLINQKGEILSPNQWFDNVYSFYEGYARVYLEGKGWNFMNQKGEIAFPNQWFDNTDSFSEGFARVKLNGRWYYINGKGELYDRDKKFIGNLREFLNEEEMNESDECFDSVGSFREGFAVIELNGEGYNFINQNGEILSPNQWYDRVGNFCEGFAWVELNKKYNFINQKGEYLSPNQWFDLVGSFYEGFAVVYLDGKGWNFINQNGEYLSPNQWFDNTGDFREGFARVELTGKGYNFINQNGDILSPNQWYDRVGNFCEGFAGVGLNGQGYNFINQNGDILSPNQWFDNCTFFKNGFAEITTSDGGVMWIDKNGKIIKQVTPDDYWRSDNTLDVSENNTQGLNSGNSLNEEEMNENEEGVDVYTPTYQLFDSGGIYNPMFYNAVHYICETVHFPLSDIYRFEEKIELDELDGVILIPNVWGKLIDGEIEYFGEYIKNGGKVYVIDPNSFELTLVDSFSKLWDYAMTTTQMECL